MIMRDKILLDANVFVAVTHPDDPHRKRALQLLEELKKNKPIFVTNNHVIDEALTVTALRSKSMVHANTLGESIYQQESPWFRIYRVSLSWEQEAFEVFRQQKIYIKDRFLSFTDCILFAQARLQNISKIFSFDQHFKRLEKEKITVIS